MSPMIAYVASSASLADPQGSSALLNAVVWLQRVLLGPAATAISVIAVASIGLAMLSGRIDQRRALIVILGCFIVFGAPLIAAGMRFMAEGGTAAPAMAANPIQPPSAPTPTPGPSTGNDPFDPYAGAAVPR